MTFLSCVVIGLAFAIAVMLLVLAGVLIGWNLPRVLANLRGSRHSGRGPADPSR